MLNLRIKSLDFLYTLTTEYLIENIEKLYTYKIILKPLVPNPFPSQPRFRSPYLKISHNLVSPTPSSSPLNVQES